MLDPADLAADLRAGVVASTVAAAMGAKKRDGEAVSPSDLFPSLRVDRPKQGWRGAKERLGGYFAMVNAAHEAGVKPARPRARKGA